MLTGTLAAAAALTVQQPGAALANQDVSDEWEKVGIYVASELKDLVAIPGICLRSCFGQENMTSALWMREACGRKVRWIVAGQPARPHRRPPTPVIHDRQ